MIHLHFLDKIMLCNSFADLQKLCGAIADQYGFEFYTLAHRVFTSLAKPQDIILSNYHDEWFDYYYEQQYHNIDPVVHASLSKSTPVIWLDTFKQHPEYLYILNESGEVGIKTGVSAAVSMPGVATMLSFASEQKSAEDLHRGALIVNICVSYFHERLLFLSSKNSKQTENLTQRQLEVVLWLAEGKDVSSIAAILKCTERTVSAHIQAIKKKTNSLNITHAVAKVLLNRGEFSRVVGTTVCKPTQTEYEP